MPELSEVVARSKRRSDTARATQPKSAASIVVTTIGYEGRTLDDLLSDLHRMDVQVVIDVRQTPISRKPGFSKTALEAALASEGLDYLHLRGLGNPKENRDALRAGTPAAHQAFQRHMAVESGARDLDVLRSTMVTRRVALLCFERDHTTCHRSMVASAVQRLDPAVHVVNI